MISRNIEKICTDYTKIENYDKAIADTTQTWDCHHRREIQDGFNIWTPSELKNIGQYYNRPAAELIFLKRSEHRLLHTKYMTANTKKKLSACHKGKQFRRKFIEHYNKTQMDDFILYYNEHTFYRKHGRCSWE